MRDLPALHNAVQDLKPPPGLCDTAPLSRFFMLCETLYQTRGEIDPRLFRRAAIHENWQWIALVLLFAGAILLGLAIKAVFLRAIQFYWRQAGPACRPDTIRSFARPLRLLIIGLIWFFGVSHPCLLGNWFQILGTASLMLAAIGRTFCLHNLIPAAGAASSRRAEILAQNSMDDVMSSPGAGLLRFLVLILAIIVIADILGLPDEGVIT